MALILHAYAPSVYCQIARMALAECSLTASIVRVDPFTGTGPNPHPFGLVPTLCDNGFEVYETAAILAWLDALYAKGRLTPTDPRARTRMVQVQSIVDSQAYWPMVRMVFAHRVFRPIDGEPPDEAVIAKGLTRAAPVLDALERIAEEGYVLTGTALTRADIHLAPMIGYFAAAPEGAEALATRPALANWWAEMRHRPSYIATAPDWSAPDPA